MPPLHQLSPHYHQLHEALGHHIQIPCTSAGQRGPFCSDKREGTKKGRGSESPRGGGGTLAGTQRGLNPRTDFCLQPSCFLPWSAPSWFVPHTLTLTPHPIKTNSYGRTTLQPSHSPACRRGWGSRGLPVPVTGPPLSSWEPGTHAPGLNSLPHPLRPPDPAAACGPGPGAVSGSPGWG